MSGQREGFFDKNGNTVILAVVGAAFLYIWQAPEKTGNILTTVQSSLAAIQEGQKATREDIGKLSDKLDSTADGLADVKAEVAAIKGDVETAKGEMDRLRDRMRDYEGDRGARRDHRTANSS